MVTRNRNSICKRLLDVVLSLAGLIIAAPLMALISAAVWLDSPGPVIFAQERMGYKGKRFRMYKFRKFPPTWGDEGPAVTAKCDIRMTRVGAILERTKLDELPQFWNILKGDMSLVGPRPDSVRFADLYRDKYAKILEYLPGIFGPNQIKFRNECEMYPADEDPETFYRRVLFAVKAETDLDYFQKANFFTDLVIILKGMWVSIGGVVNWRMFLGRDAGVMALDALLVATSWFLAHLLRFSGLPDGPDLDLMTRGLVISPVLLVFGMAAGGCYRHPKELFSLHDAIRLIFVVTCAWLMIFILLVGLYRNISLYLAPITGFILLSFLMAPRLMRYSKWQKFQHGRQTSSNRIILYGAGRVGIGIATLIGNGSLIGFLDDAPSLKGRIVAGKPVLGSESDILTILKARPFNEIWITFEPNDPKFSRLQALCHEQNVKLHVLPSMEPFSRVLQHSNVEMG